MGVQHSFQVRTDGVSPAALGTAVDAFLDALSPLLFATIVDYVTYRPSGSTVANIVTTGIEGNSYGSGTGTAQNVAGYVDFVGRSSGGRRVRLAVFGVNNIGTDYRFVAGENADVTAARAVLNGTANTFIAIDGIAAVWKSYANAGFNARWQREIRP